MQVTITPYRKTHLQVVGLVDGQPRVYETFNPAKEDDRKRINKLTNVADAEILRVAMVYRDDPAAPPTVIETQQAGPAPFVCTRRPMYASSGRDFSAPHPFDAFDMALADADGGDVIEWEDASRLAVLDVDYHNRATDDRPRPEDLLNYLARIRPTPAVAWVSKGRGLHAVYYAENIFAADELAACAGISWLGVDSSATFEVLNRTGVPPGEVVRSVQVADPSAVAKWLAADVTDEQVDAYLIEHGFTRGKAYPHKVCPMLPTEESHGEPVFVGDFGIVCKKCEALGVACGSRKAGFFPYRSLIHGETPGHVRLMAKNLTHYEHAKLVLADTLRVRGQAAELGYRALLKFIHGDDPRVERVFTGGNDLIRLDNRWATRDALAAYDKHMMYPILQALPACQTGGGKINNETVSRFTQSIDLSEYGYPAVTPIRGLRIYSHRLGFSDPDRISVVVPSGVLRSPAMERYRPRYVPAHRRIPDPWAVVEEPLPGVNRSYVQLLIAAKGVAEGQVGLPPNLLVCGPTAAGKSLMTTLAAALAGDHNTEVQWQRSVERFRQAVADGADKGTFVTVNEVLKDAERSGSTAVQALDVFLNLTPDSVHHKMYVGPVPIGRLPVCVVTDISVPQVLRNDQQLARRFVYVRLRDAHPEWVESIAASGLFDVRRFRAIGERQSAAADAIVSEVIDRFFDRPRTLAEIAKELGYSLLTESPDFDDPTEELRHLYRAACDAPDGNESITKRWAGKGWKIIQPGDETPLAEAWENVNDGNDGGEKWYTSRRASACDWRHLLGGNADIRLETRRWRQYLAIRYRSGDKLNGDIDHACRTCAADK